MQGGEAAEPESVVIDTMIASRLLTAQRSHPLIVRYRLYLRGRNIVLSFATVAELRYGAYKANWGERKLGNLEAQIRKRTVEMPDSELVETCARLRAECEKT
jgi:predicted nucleic acid-binding protein